MYAVTFFSVVIYIHEKVYYAPAFPVVNSHRNLYIHWCQDVQAVMSHRDKSWDLRYVIIRKTHYQRYTFRTHNICDKGKIHCSSEN